MLYANLTYPLGDDMQTACNYVRGGAGVVNALDPLQAAQNCKIPMACAGGGTAQSDWYQRVAAAGVGFCNAVAPSTPQGAPVMQLPLPPKPIVVAQPITSNPLFWVAIIGGAAVVGGGIYMMHRKAA